MVIGTRGAERRACCYPRCRDQPGGTVQVTRVAHHKLVHGLGVRHQRGPAQCLRDGGAFILRAEVCGKRLRIEGEDAGGSWRDGPNDDGRPHGFDVVTALAGAGNWGIDGDARGRVAWARLGG